MNRKNSFAQLQRPRPSIGSLSDAELQRELTYTAGARWTPRKQLFDALYDELQRRRSRQ
jgi:hypothetical protein